MIDQDAFVVEQLIRPLVNLYQVSANGAPVAFCRQKRMALKEDIRFYADEGESRELFRIAARRVIDIGGRYDVLDEMGQRIGVLEHAFKQSLLRSTWRIYDASEELVATVRERSMPRAIIRRVIDFVPYGEVVPIPYHFDFFLADGRDVGGLDRKFSFRDRYELDLSGDTERRIDRRVAVALAVGLDALQGR